MSSAPDSKVPRKSIDASTGFELESGVERFSQRNDIFNRAHWDPEIRNGTSSLFFQSYAMREVKPRAADGFTQRDYAMRNAAWHFTELLSNFGRNGNGRQEGILDTISAHSPGSDERLLFEKPEQATKIVKKAARVFGADLVGICAHDERWIYADKFQRSDQSNKPIDLPEGLRHVIVIATAMQRDLTKTSPSSLAGAATGVGYSKDALTLISLTQFVRNLGYEAHGSMNDTALSIPLAVQAGLGEYGRHGLLITPEFGPGVRIGKIFTDLPLMNDAPKRSGVTEFCGICQKCARACPPKAIPSGKPNSDVPNSSSQAKIKKWTTDAERCFGFWVAQNTECSVCLRACPFDRDYSRWPSRLWRRLAGSPLRHIALGLDRFTRGTERVPAKSWWNA